MESPSPLDLRQQRTRDLLFKALLELLAEKPLSTISVSDLTRRAKIARPTFYLHFKEVADVLMARLEVDLMEQRAAYDALFSHPHEDALEQLAEVASFAFKRIADAPHFYHFILSGQASSEVFERVQTQIKGFIQSHLEMFQPQNPLPEPTLAYMSSYLTGAISGMMRTWIEQGMVPSADEVGKMFIRWSAGEIIYTLQSTEDSSSSA